jgi:hypothetical protein
MEEAGSGHEDQSQHTNVGCLVFLSRSQVTPGVVMQCPPHTHTEGPILFWGHAYWLCRESQHGGVRGVVPAWQVSGRFV